MEESDRKVKVENGDKEILYSKIIHAGKRIYYLDVKRNLRDDLFLAITESKKVVSKDGGQTTFEKHKIFLYKEDFEKFMGGLDDVISYIDRRKKNSNLAPATSSPQPESSTDDLK